jgi:hypothetical protein
MFSESDQLYCELTSKNWHLLASGTNLKSGKGLYYFEALLLPKGELRFFSLFRNSDRLAGTFRWSEDPCTA